MFAALFAVLAAADISDQTVGSWVVQIVQLALVGVLSFFMKRTLDQIESGIGALSTKVDALKDTRAVDHTHAQLLEQRLVSLEHTVSELKAELRELSEGKRA